MATATTSKVPRRSPGSVKLGPGNAGYYQARGREALEAALKATRTTRGFQRDTLTEIQATKLRDRLIITTRLETEALTQQLVDGSISLNNWRTKMGAVVIPAHHAMVMASTGRTVIDPADRKAFERLVNDQLAFLDRFQRDVKAGRQLLDGTAINRARQYGSAPWALAQNVERDARIRDGFDQYRLILGGTEHHCRQCPIDASRGWVPIGSLAPIGGRTCRMGCRCRFTFRKGPGAKAASAEGESGSAGAPLQPPPSRPPATAAARLADLERRIAEARREAEAASGNDRASVMARVAARDKVIELEGYVRRVQQHGELSKAVPGLIPAGPIQERIAEYTEGHEVVRKLAALDRRSADDRRLHKQIAIELDEVLARTMEPGYVSNPSDRAKYSELIATKEILSRRLFEETQKNRVEALKILGVADPDRLPIGGTGKVAGESDKAFDYVGRVVAKGENTSSMSIEVKALRSSQRPEASNDGKSIKLNKDGEAGVGVHEIGHALDARLTLGGEKALARSLEFLRYRVGDEPFKPMAEVSPMAGYEADELGRKDKFDAAFPGSSAYYVGKGYRGTATEILAMGMEKLYRDPAGFARQDPEYVSFIIGIIKGPLR